MQYSYEQILKENGFKITESNIRILKEGLESGRYDLIPSEKELYEICDTFLNNAYELYEEINKMDSIEFQKFINESSPIEVKLYDTIFREFSEFFETAEENATLNESILPDEIISNQWRKEYELLCQEAALKENLGVGFEGLVNNLNESNNKDLMSRANEILFGKNRGMNLSESVTLLERPSIIPPIPTGKESFDLGKWWEEQRPEIGKKVGDWWKKIKERLPETTSGGTGEAISHGEAISQSSGGGWAQTKWTDALASLYQNKMQPFFQNAWGGIKSGVKDATSTAGNFVRDSGTKLAAWGETPIGFNTLSALGALGALGIGITTAALRQNKKVADARGKYAAQLMKSEDFNKMSDEDKQAVKDYIATNKERKGAGTEWGGRRAAVKARKKEIHDANKYKEAYLKNKSAGLYQNRVIPKILDKLGITHTGEIKKLKDSEREELKKFIDSSKKGLDIVKKDIKHGENGGVTGRNASKIKKASETRGKEEYSKNQASKTTEELK